MYPYLLLCPHCQYPSLGHHHLLSLDYFSNLLTGFLAFGSSKAASKLLDLSDQLILDHVTLILRSVQRVLAACGVKLQLCSLWIQFMHLIFLILKYAQLLHPCTLHPTHTNASYYTFYPSWTNLQSSIKDILCLHTVYHTW